MAARGAANVADSLEAILGKFFGSAIDASVTLSREAHLYGAQLSVHFGRGILLQSEAAADAPYLAYDEAAQRLTERLRRYKRRLRDHHGAAVEGERASQYVLAAEPDGEAEASLSDGASDHVVVAEVQTEVPTLTVGEAVMRLDLANHTAMLFRNRAHGGLNLIYRRSDGNFGWVGPGAERRN